MHCIRCSHFFFGFYFLVCVVFLFLLLRSWKSFLISCLQSCRRDNEVRCYTMYTMYTMYTRGMRPPPLTRPPQPQSECAGFRVENTSPTNQLVRIAVAAITATVAIATAVAISAAVAVVGTAVVVIAASQAARSHTPDPRRSSSSSRRQRTLGQNFARTKETRAPNIFHVLRLKSKHQFGNA